MLRMTVSDIFNKKSSISIVEIELTLNRAVALHFGNPAAIVFLP